MNSEQVHKVADAVLYEGYLLYPYRPSALKNRQRWPFGVLYPPAYAQTTGEASLFETQLLVVGADAVLDIEVRFLHLRATEQPEGGVWQEACDRSVDVCGLKVSDLLTHPENQRFSLRGSFEGLESLEGNIEVSATRLSAEANKVTIAVANQTAVCLPANTTRDEASMHALVSAHAIVKVANGQFISPTDPPEQFRDAAAACSHTGVWPVLAGETGAHDCMLISPIILSDYPQIAPESAGDLFDSSEIDEILTLRILTMTDAEKEEMRNGDERARRLLERTEALGPEQLMKLHGVLRSPHGIDRVPGKRK